jgi:hypothetical protein
MSDRLLKVDGPTANSSDATGLKVMTAVLWLAVVTALAIPAIKGGVFDAMATDDAMRLAEVRDLIGGQGWFDLAQHRLDPPGGGSMHWSRLIDLPLAALVLMLRPFAGSHGAEAIMLVLWPALLFAATLLLISGIAKRMVDGPGQTAARFAAVLLAALASPALIHYRAGAIDHHNAQIVLLLALILLTTELERSSVKAGLAGLAAALSLAVGLEMLPAVGSIGVVILGLLVWKGAAVDRPVSVFGAALVGSSLLLALGLLPLPSLGAPVCDAFGGPVLLLAAGGGMTLMAIAVIDSWYRSFSVRLTTAVIAGLVLVVTFFRLFPGCLASPYAQVDPLVTSFWLDHVAETMSIQTLYELEPQKIPGFYGFPLLTLGLAIAASIRCDVTARFRWLVATVALVALVSISLWEQRGSAAANMVAAPLFAVSLASLWPARKHARLLALAALVASPTGFALSGLAARPLIDHVIKPQWTVAPDDAVSSCRDVSSVAPLAALPPGRVMAPIDLGPAILVATPHAVFAAPYHRNNDGNLAMLNAMLDGPDAARTILRDRHVDYVVLCRGAPEQIDFKRLAPDGLAMRLLRNDVPDFLGAIELDPASQLAVWRVRG